MRTSRLVLSTMVVAACGISEPAFIPDYTDLYCDYVLECASEAELTFDGINNHEECTGVYGPGVELWGEGCDYKAGKARRCIRAMKDLTCPGEATALEDAVPVECDEVYVECTTTQKQDEVDDTAVP